MSRVELLERVRDSPERARSLLTVRAAIASALLSDAPRSLTLPLTCSYWRALFVPFLTPRGGMAHLLSSLASTIDTRYDHRDIRRHRAPANRSGGRAADRGRGPPAARLDPADRLRELHVEGGPRGQRHDPHQQV